MACSQPVGRPSPCGQDEPELSYLPQMFRLMREKLKQMGLDVDQRKFAGGELTWPDLEDNNIQKTLRRAENEVLAWYSYESNSGWCQARFNFWMHRWIWGNSLGASTDFPYTAADFAGLPISERAANIIFSKSTEEEKTRAVKQMDSILEYMQAVERKNFDIFKYRYTFKSDIECENPTGLGAAPVPAAHPVAAARQGQQPATATSKVTAPTTAALHVVAVAVIAATISPPRHNTYNEDQQYRNLWELFNKTHLDLWLAKHRCKAWEVPILDGMEHLVTDEILGQAHDQTVPESVALSTRSSDTPGVPLELRVAVVSGPQGAFRSLRVRNCLAETYSSVVAWLSDAKSRMDRGVPPHDLSRKLYMDKNQDFMTHKGMTDAEKQLEIALPHAPRDMDDEESE
ncbi:hypothetical protein B0T19DRAFT_483196 [Cercophora scortea]|uniref:Uncharacterized protein n=1 Tax=Cercophora scortea TaxID=314031 RepID=A0AAE0IY62_9PEZI|nr:hypothetical protein B0T19DRAFT_483196 [Cercophora scortea]